MKSIFILSILMSSVSFAKATPENFSGHWVGTCSSGGNSFTVSFFIENHENEISIPFVESGLVFSPFKDVETFSTVKTTSEDYNMLRHKWAAKKSAYIVGQSLHTDALAVGIGVRSKKGTAFAVHHKTRFRLLGGDKMEVTVAWTHKVPLAKKSLETSPDFICSSLTKART